MPPGRCTRCCPGGLPPARIARLSGQRAHVFVPGGVHPAAVTAIAAEGAQVTEITGTYDDAMRLAAQAAAAGAAGPVLVVIPAGVGSLAQAGVTHYRSRPDSPAIALLTVEPGTAACVLASLVRGELGSIQAGETIMAGLNCGTPSMLAWPYLRDGPDATVLLLCTEGSAANPLPVS